MRETVLQRILQAASDSNIRFDDLRKGLIAVGFVEERVKGSHHIFVHPDVEEILNLQPRSSFAKPYQVKQVRKILVRYKLVSDTA